MSSADGSPKKKHRGLRRRRERDSDASPYSSLSERDSPLRRVKANLFTPEASPETPNAASRPTRLTTARSVRC